MQNTCTRLCSQGPPDSCREDFEPVGTGSYCTVFEGVFYDGLGMCIDACNPDNDEASDGGATINTDCEPGEVCVASAEREAAVCLPPDANGL
tara:strand:- start:4130 stop:4405 length:276 start_codon:yes stop_codon:yes gene_type:complete